MPPSSLVARAVFAAALLVYAAVALLVLDRWVSGLAAPLVATLLWTRHARARFSAYVLFSVVGVRGLLAGDWALAGFAAAAILVLQTPAAQQAWPRLQPSTRRGESSRMTRP